MKRWFAKLFYGKRIRRLEQVQQAAALLAQSREEEAAPLLERARPTAWLEDVALYHFVSGKMAMAQGDLEDADRHLQTALGLGMDRPAVKLNLAVLRLRQCRLVEAADLLGDAALDDDPDLVEQVRVMRSVIRDLRAQRPAREVAERAQRFREKYLRPEGPDGESTRSRLARLAHALRSHKKLSRKHLEDAALCYGELLASRPGAAWVYGLEATDHLVVAEGLLFCPYALVTRFRSGLLEELPTPENLSPLLSEAPVG